MATAEELFKQLDEKLVVEDFAGGLGVCQSILNLKKDDKEGLQCKVVCLIHLKKFEEAKQLLETDPVLVGLKNEMIFEYCYCLYGLSLFEQAQQKIESALVSSSDAGVSSRSSSPLSKKLRLLLAQVFYRSKQFDKAMNLFEEICGSEPTNVEARCNFVASCAGPSLWNQTFSSRSPFSLVGANKSFGAALKEHEDQMKQSHELSYNVATWYISEGRFADASEALALSHKICTETAKTEQWSKEETDDELAIINCQTAYLAHLHGSSEAEKMYSDVIHSNPSDKVVVTVASNNISTLHGDHNLFDSHKKLERNFTLLEKSHENHSQLISKLTPYQKHTIYYNHALVLLKMGTKDKVRQAEEFTKEMIKLFPQSPFPTLLLSSIYLRRGQVALSLEVLSNYLKQDTPSEPENDFRSPLIRLAIAQIKYQQKNYQEAIAVLTDSGDAIHFPAVTQVVVMASLKIGDVNGAFQILQNAVNYFRVRTEKMGGFQPNSKGEALFVFNLYKKMLSSLADFAMARARYSEALRCFNTLTEIDGSSKSHLLSKFVALAHVDPDQAVAMEKKLGMDSEIDISSVDAASLEALPASSLSQHPSEKPKLKKESGDVVPTEQAAKKKKKKKRKLVGKRRPKKYDESFVHPDSERWLPLRERSYYKRKRGRRDKNQNLRGGHQGAASLDSLAQTSSSSTGAPPARGGNVAPAARGGGRSRGRRGKR